MLGQRSAKQGLRRFEDACDNDIVYQSSRESGLEGRYDAQNALFVLMPSTIQLGTRNIHASLKPMCAQNHDQIKSVGQKIKRNDRRKEIMPCLLAKPDSSLHESCSTVSLTVTMSVSYIPLFLGSAFAGFVNRANVTGCAGMSNVFRPPSCRDGRMVEWCGALRSFKISPVGSWMSLFLRIWRKSCGLVSMLLGNVWICLCHTMLRPADNRSERSAAHTLASDSLEALVR